MYYGLYSSILDDRIVNTAYQLILILTIFYTLLEASFFEPSLQVPGVVGVRNVTGMLFRSLNCVTMIFSVSSL